MELQQTLGNAAVADLITRAGSWRVSRPAVQRIDDPAVIPVPQVGQAPLDLKAQHAIRFIYRELGPSAVRALMKEVLTEQLPAAVAATKVDANFPFDPPPDDATKVLNAYKVAVDGAPHDNAWQAMNAVWNDASLAAIPSRFTLINHLFALLKAQLVPKARAKWQRLDIEVDKRQKNLKATVGTGPDAPTKLRFAAALKSMPGLNRLISDLKARAAKGLTGASAPVSAIGAKETKWQDGGRLVDKITKVPATPAQSPATDSAPELATFTEGVQRADNFYRRLVEADVLKNIRRPSIAYHLVNSFDRVGANVDGNGKESFVANQEGDTVHLGQGVFPHIVVHEVGHYIEDNAPRKNWLDIELLMQSRHQQAGGGALVAGPGGARLAGAYPATGDYTSRAYTTGTEVSSMTLENLVQPGRLDAMIDADPQMVAVVIRMVRPGSYASHSALRAFDQFLP